MGWVALGNLLYPLIVGGIGTVLALVGVAFTKFGDKLFGFALQRNLQAYKHAFEKEIEELRAKLGRLTDRSIRSNEREYVAIVAAWEGFVEAYFAFMNTIARSEQFRDLSQMSDEDFAAWANGVKLEATDAETIRRAPDRNGMYSRYLTIKAMNDALRANFDARQCILKQGIFIPRALEAQFQYGIDRISMALAARNAEIDNRATDSSARELGDFLREGQGLFDVLKDAARAQLMYSETRTTA